MRRVFYPKLAWEGIRKNKRIYLPYLLAGTVMVMMYYILSFLSGAEFLEHMKGGGTLRMVLPLGCWVIAVFSVLFLFYGNSFMLRQRNQEFGLYNILGMDKRNLLRILFWETAMSCAISVFTGLALGIALSKLAETGMRNLLHEEIDYALRLDVGCMTHTASMFLAIYAVLLLHAVWKVCRSNPIELLRSSAVGEKPPKANWLLAGLGVVILAGAYAIAVSVQEPIAAILSFFFAVLMVIAATYLLFVAGSVALCRLLQKNKRYYYRPNHFVSVSTMTYRMKRNGAGLASICILLTMVLVMLSSTLSLYIGAEDSLNQQYPYDISLRLPIPDLKQWNGVTFGQLRKAVEQRVSDRRNVQEYGFCEMACQFTEDGALVEAPANTAPLDDLGYLCIVSLEDYNRVMGTEETLREDECILLCWRITFPGSTFSVQNSPALQVKSFNNNTVLSSNSSVLMVPTVTLVTADFEGLVGPLLSGENTFGNPTSLYWSYSFDMQGRAEKQIAAYERLREDMSEIVIRDADGSYSYTLNGREQGSAEFYGLYGGLLFIGILLSIVFLFAAVLILYYKQISEGYEDQKRFAIMQNVGMTKQDIRRSINSQVLTLFFLPLGFAGLHLGFAFPMIWKMLQLFCFQNLTLMIGVTAGCLIVFGVCYAMVYKLTANVYFGIVSTAVAGKTVPSVNKRPHACQGPK